MSRMLKVYQADKKSIAAIPGARAIAVYPAFMVVEVDDAALATLMADHALTEDITDQYAIAHVGGSTTAAALPAGPHHYLVQFIGPIKKAWLAAVRKAGGEVVAPWADFVVVARLPEAAVAAVSALPMVRWLGHLAYGARVSSSVTGARSGEQPDPQTPRTRLMPGCYVVQFFAPDRADSARLPIEQLGFEIVDGSVGSDLLIVRPVISATGKRADLAQRLKALSRVHGVRRIAPQVIRRTSNDRAGVIMGTEHSIRGLAGSATAGLGLSGQGEVIGVCDTGLDNGDPASIHPDFKGRVAAIVSYPMTAGYADYVTNPGDDDGPSDLDSGHGTHTAGSVLSDGVSSAGLPELAGPVRGLAYQARLVFQAVEQLMKWKDPAYNVDPGRYLLAGLPADLRPLFQWAYDKGARIHSNSWGGGGPGVYDEQSQQVDQFVWQHPDFCLLFAAGNDGTDHNRNGVVDPGSVTPPGTAKNCITVGATENYRPQMAVTYGQWPKDYPVAPLRDDKLADDPDEVAAFSSRGPTKDGRIKPEVVAPGTFVLSTRSRLLAANQYGYGRYASSKLYMFDSGTSMATPLTAGAVGLLREYLRKRAKIARPSAALLKASLIAGAVRLGPPAGPSAGASTGSSAGSSAGSSPGSSTTGPDNAQGFGRVNLDDVLAPPAPITARFIDGAGLATGAKTDTSITISSGGKSLKVVLAYSDYPGPKLVNNLNLIVTGPDGGHHLGNGKAGSTGFDSTNNVEVVEVAAAAAGVWQVSVVGSNVSHGPQPYALVILAAMG